MNIKIRFLLIEEMNKYIYSVPCTAPIQNLFGSFCDGTVPYCIHFSVFSSYISTRAFKQILSAFSSIESYKILKNTKKFME